MRPGEKDTLPAIGFGDENNSEREYGAEDLALSKHFGGDRLMRFGAGIPRLESPPLISREPIRPEPPAEGLIERPRLRARSALLRVQRLFPVWSHAQISSESFSNRGSDARSPSSRAGVIQAAVTLESTGSAFCTDQVLRNARTRLAQSAKCKLPTQGSHRWETRVPASISRGEAPRKMHPGLSAGAI